MKILLVDDHILFAKSLSIALCDNPEIEQFSSTKDIQNLEKQIATELPDILLIDINLGGLADEDGLMLTQHLLERFPDQKIVILSGYNLPVYRKEAKSIGARGFISKDVEPDELSQHDLRFLPADKANDIRRLSNPMLFPLRLHGYPTDQ